MAKILDIKNIKVNYMLSDRLGEKIFTESPLDNLMINTKDHNEIIEKYLDGV